MKYIRTKDAIYDTSNMKWCECSKQASYYKDKNYMHYVPIKTADTIEELCDGFVVISEEYVEPHYVKELIDTNALDFENHWRPYGNGKVLNKFCQELIDAVIYGAIWTDRGLKYVAKMNDKGEMELL